MNQNQLNTNPQSIKIIWGALLASHFFYGVALVIVLKEQAPQELQIPIVAALSMMAVMMCILSFVLPRMLINQIKKDKFKNSSDLHTANLSALVQLYLTPFIIKLALLESGALFGFALAFMHKRIELFFPFAMLSIGIFLMNFPSEAKIKAAFKSV